MTELQQKFLNFCKNEPVPFEPSPAQQRAIFDRVNIVPAGAGSGKTAVLAHRFVWLIMSNKDMHADEILTMTFTKDATASMKKKIYVLLVQAVEEKLIDKVELENFSSSTITTTDGFCSEIAKSACSNYGLSSTFEIESETDLEHIAEQVTDSIFTKHENDRNIKQLLSLWSFENFRDFFKELVKKHISISREIDFSKSKDLIKKTFNNDVSQLEAKMIGNLNQIVEMYSSSKKGETLYSNLKIINDYLDTKSFDSLVKLAKVAETVGSDDCKNLVKTVKDQAFDIAKVHPMSMDVLDTLIGLCEEFQAAILKHKRETAHVTYHDVLLMAIDTLSSNNVIRNYYQNKFKAIMVDEFQDNNEDNKKLVDLLARDPSIIFMVGDEKQSIYRFRDADVSVFKRMKTQYESMNESLIANLPDNYRSEGKLIETINCLFENVMSNASSDFEASYSKLVSNKNKVEPTIKLFYGLKGDGTTVESEAYNIAKTIKEILTTRKNEYQIQDKDKIRDPRENDIAILLKVGTNQIEYERALRAYGINYEASETKSLTVDAVLNDFYNVLQLAVWGPDDGISLLGYLKSPLCNCSDDSIVANEELDTETICDVRRSLSNSTIAETVSLIWNKLGYRFRVLKNEKNQQYEEHYEYLFALATSFDQQNKTVVEFLDYLRPMLGEECKIKDLQIQREGSKGVIIQSIHKSKGLDYPIVIIPDMQSGTHGHGGFNPRIQLVEGVLTLPYVKQYEKSGLRFANPFINKDLDSKMDLAETKRVLYVAATRAKNHLLFSGIIPEKITIDSAFNKTMLSCLLEACNFTRRDNQCSFEPDYGEHPERCAKIDFVKFDNSAYIEDSDQQNSANYKDSWYSNPRRFSFTKLTNAITSLDNDKITNFDKPLPLYDCDNAVSSSTDFGTYVHSLLEHAVNGTFFETDVDDVVKRDALQMCKNFTDSDFYKSLNGFEKYTEKGFFYFDNDRNEVMEGIVDLLCVSKDKVVIVDYKTDKYKDTSTHKDQLQMYTKAMSVIYRRKVEAYLFYVRSGESEKLFDSTEM